MATGAGMVGRMLMHAADDGCGFVGVAGNTLHCLGMIRMGVSGDGRVTGAALEGAMHAGVEHVRIDAGVVAGRVLHGDVAMTGEAVGLGAQMRGKGCEEQSGAE